jgi:hypothetical protein
MREHVRRSPSQRLVEPAADREVTCADFAKPVNRETVLLSCNSADRVPKPPGSFMRCVDALDVGEL